VHRQDEKESAEIDIETSELFRALSGPRQNEVRARLHQRVFERQQVLYFEGHPADRLWIVRRGRVRLYKSSSAGQITTLDVLGPGEIFGAVSAIESDVYPCSAETVTDACLWWMPRETFLKLLDEEPRLGVEILHILSRRLHEAHDRLRAFAHDPAPARLARALLHAASSGEAHVTRRALAEASGTTVETAIRVLRRWEREGLLKGEVGRIQVLDAEALRALAGR